MTDDQIRTLLRIIRDLTLLEYPYPGKAGDEPNDLRLIVALGEIGGVATRALEEKDENL